MENFTNESVNRTAANASVDSHKGS